MLQLPLKQDRRTSAARQAQRAPVQGYCPWCRASIADMSRLQIHFKLLHPLSAEFDALSRRTGD